MKEYKMAICNQDKMRKMQKGCRCTTGFFRLILTAAALMTMCTALFGCTEAKKELSVDELVSGVLDKVAFEDELTEVDASMASTLYGIEDFVSARIYRGSGATSEEFAVLEAKDSADAKEINETLLSHIESQKTLYAGYMPEEVSRLDKAILLRSDRHVILCVTDDGNAEGIIKSLLP